MSNPYVHCSISTVAEWGKMCFLYAQWMWLLWKAKTDCWLCFEIAFLTRTLEFNMLHCALIVSGSLQSPSPQVGTHACIRANSTGCCLLIVSGYCCVLLPKFPSLVLDFRGGSVLWLQLEACPLGMRPALLATPSLFHEWDPYFSVPSGSLRVILVL